MTLLTAVNLETQNIGCICSANTPFGSNSALVILGLMAVIPKGPLQSCILYKLGKETAPAVKDLPSKNTNK